MKIKIKYVVRIILPALLILLAAPLLQGDDSLQWFPFHIPWHYCEGSRVDVSFLLDAPSGKHGFVTVKDGHFYFENGKRIRFWGLNIHANQACFPEHKQAEDIAKRLAQLGCNMVRMHFLDSEAPGGIIDPKYNDSQHFSASQMEKLDYFIYQLKMNGIYLCFDVLGLGARRFKEGDNVPEFEKISRGIKAVSFIDNRIIELSRKYAFRFLRHVNKYTGNAYLDEPAIAMVEMANENSIFMDSHKYFPDYYRKEMDVLWAKSLSQRNKTRGDFKGHWSLDKEFLSKLQEGYQQEMYKYLRSIGVKVPIAGSNIPYDNIILALESRMDFIDIHVYWDLADKLDRIHNQPLIMQSHLSPNTIVNRMTAAKVKNKPLVSTEWGSLWPNDWRSLDVLSTASYAGLNDWDGLLLYAYNGGWDMSWDNLENKLYYATVIFNDPAKMGVFPIAGLIFLRQGVISDAGEIISDSEKGIFILKTAKTFSFSGFVANEKKCEFSGIMIKSDAFFATFTITSLDDKDIQSSSHLLLTTVGRSRNTNQKFTSTMDKTMLDTNRAVYILDRGTAPILVESIDGEISIKRQRDSEHIEVFPLDEKGLRKSPVPVEEAGDTFSFRVSGEHRTIYYEIIRDDKGGMG